MKVKRNVRIKINLKFIYLPFESAGLSIGENVIEIEDVLLAGRPPSDGGHPQVHRAMFCDDLQCQARFAIVSTTPLANSSSGCSSLTPRIIAPRKHPKCHCCLRCLLSFHRRRCRHRRLFLAKITNNEIFISMRLSYLPSAYISI